MKNYKLLLLFFWVINISSVYSYSGNEHIDGWISILGISSKHRSKLQEFSNQIDLYQPFYDNLKREFPSFDWGRYGHRLLFHWGFSSHPSSNQALEQQLDYKKIEGEEREEFYNLLIQEQQRRNRKMIELTVEIFKSRIMSSRIASIIYDIHILQDYDTSLKEPLADKNMLFSDIISNSTLVFGSDFYPVRDRLNQAKYCGDVIVFLDILGDELPSLIKHKFGRI